MFSRLPYLTVWLCALISSAAFGSQPNIIIILTDDMGHNDLGIQTYPNQTDFYPNSGPQPNFNTNSPDPDWPQPNEARTLTPAIDSLGEQGLKMTRFYTTPICSPSRAMLLTGRYPKRMGITRVFFPTANSDPSLEALATGGLNTAEATLPELLRENGYATGMIGKWHLGYRPGETIPFQMMPTRHGFQEFYGVPHSNDISSFSLIENETILENSVQAPKPQAKLTWRYTERALDFIQRKTAEDKPFFLYLAHSQTHIPCYPSDETFTNADGTTWPKFLGQSGISSYYDVVMETDHSTQRILDKLDDLGIADDTIVIFTSDNGAWLISNADSTLFSVGSNYPLKDGKQSTDEGGVRVPFLVRWPAQIPAGSVSDQVSGLQDLLPTLINVCGGTVPSDRTIDGIDMTSIWKGEASSFTRVAAMFFYEFYTVVVKDNWKLGYQVLYDLNADIQERTNLYSDSDYSAVRVDMEAERDAINLSITNESTNRGDFTAYEVELSDNDVVVDEGGSATFDLRLSADPGESVTVDTARFSGDTDLSVANGASLDFSSANWDQWQTVTLAAAEDVDASSDGATFRVTCSAISPVRELFAFESDDEAPAHAVASLVWPKIDPVTTFDSTVKLVGEGSVQIGAAVDPAGSSYTWHKVSGPGAVSFSDQQNALTSIGFSEDGTYTIRLKADGVTSSGFGTIDFVTNVGSDGGAADLEYAPTLAYNSTLDSDADAVWENTQASGSRDWTLSAGMTQTVSDPAPNLDFIDSAWVFPGGTTDGGSSTTLDAYSTSDASIEVWFQPTLPMSGKQVLWESGGDVGSSLTLDGDTLVLSVDQNSGAIAQSVVVPVSARDNFIHCVASIDLTNSEIRLYVDGALRESASISGVSDWCGGGSASGVGNIYQTVSSTPNTTFNELGGNDQLTGTYTGFDGAIAVLRFYESALELSAVADLFDGPDRPPVISAGADQSVAFSSGAALNGSVTVNGSDASGSMNVLWRQSEGPGLASIGDSSMSATSSSFDLPGVYTLWFEADDSEVKICDALAITVAPLSFAEWKADYVFPVGEDGAADNPDADALDTLWEWVVGTNPVVADLAADPIDFSISEELGLRKLRLQFDVPRDRDPAISFVGGDTLPLSNDLSASGTTDVEVVSPTMKRHTFTYEVPQTQTKFFLGAEVAE